jgi:pyrimidine deaminase RibD-like protein
MLLYKVGLLSVFHCKYRSIALLRRDLLRVKKMAASTGDGGGGSASAGPRLAVTPLSGDPLEVVPAVAGGETGGETGGEIVLTLPHDVAKADLPIGLPIVEGNNVARYGGGRCGSGGDGAAAAVTTANAAVGKVFSAHHRVCMELAVREAGKSVPSPKAYCVGCVLVPRGTAEALDDTSSVATAVTRAAAAAAVLAAGFSRELPGNTHAEQCALIKMQSTGTGAAGCDMYTTMEPCSKRLSGNVPCVKNCIKHGVGRVFVGVREPAHFVRCEGVAQLAEAGIPCFDVVYDGVEAACLAPNRHIAKFSERAKHAPDSE